MTLGEGDRRRARRRRRLGVLTLLAVIGGLALVWVLDAHVPDPIEGRRNAIIREAQRGVAPGSESEDGTGDRTYGSATEHTEGTEGAGAEKKPQIPRVLARQEPRSAKSAESVVAPAGVSAGTGGGIARAAERPAIIELEEGSVRAPAYAGEALLRLRRGASAEALRRRLTDVGAEVTATIEPLGVLRVRWAGALDVRPQLARLGLDPALQQAEPHWVHDLIPTTGEQGDGAGGARTHAESRPGGAEAVPRAGSVSDGLAQAPGDSALSTRPSALGWALERLNAPAAWEYTRGDARVRIALLDSGVDAAHPLLAGRVLEGRGFVGPEAGTADLHGHGTQMALLMVGAGDQGQGVRGKGQGEEPRVGPGIAPDCRVLPVRVFDETGRTGTFALLSGLAFAHEQGAQVVCMAFASPARSALLEEACRDLRHGGALLVAAIGNDGWDGRDVYPACFESVVAVGGTDRDDRPWARSNRHRAVLMAAPGVAVPTDCGVRSAECGFPEASGCGFCHFERSEKSRAGRDRDFSPGSRRGRNDNPPSAIPPPQSVDAVSGTSASTALAAGVAALVRARFPELSPDAALAQTLRGAADPAPAGRDDAAGFGRLDAGAAVGPQRLAFHDLAVMSAALEDACLAPGQEGAVLVTIQNLGTFAEYQVEATVTVQGAVRHREILPRLRPGEGRLLRVPFDPAECDGLCAGENHSHSYVPFTASVQSLAAAGPDARPDNDRRTVRIARDHAADDGEERYLLQAANSNNKDFAADAPWRVKDDQTAIPFCIVLKDCGDDELDELRSLTIWDVSNPAAPIVFQHSFNRERIGDNPSEAEYWIFATAEAKQAANLVDTTPLTAANLGYGLGQSINFKVEIVFRDNLSSLLGFDERYTQYLRVRVGDASFPRWDDWYYVDTHYHTMYTNNIAEWGGPPVVTAQAARALGLHYVTMTDHSCDLDERADGPISYRTDLYQYRRWENGAARTVVQDNRAIPFSGTTWDALGLEETLHSDATLKILRNVELNAASVEPATLNKTLHLLVFDNAEIFSALSGTNIPAVANESPVNVTLQQALDQLRADGTQDGFAYAAHPTDAPSSMVGGAVYGPADYALALTYERFRGLQGFNERPLYLSANELNPWPDFDAKKPDAVPYPTGLTNALANYDTLLSAQLTAGAGGMPRKLRWLAGSDAHFDFNYRRYLNSTGGEDATDAALGKARTLVYVPDPGNQWDPSNLPPRQAIYAALKKGEGVATDGPLVRFQIDDKNGTVARMAEDCVALRGVGAELTVEYLTTAEFGPVQTLDLYRGDPATGAAPLLLHSWTGAAVAAAAGTFGPLNMDTFVASGGLPLLPAADGWVYYRARIVTTNANGEPHHGFTNPIWVYAGLPGALPTVTGVTPIWAYNDAPVTLTVTGTGFVGTPRVTLSDGVHTETAVNVQATSGQQLTCDLAAGAFPANNYRVTVTTAAGSGAGTPGAGSFAVMERAPILTAALPATVSDAAATTLILTGQNFRSTSGVRLNDPQNTALQNITPLSWTQVQATVPAGIAVGSYPVFVFNTAGSNPPSVNVSVAPAPRPAAVTPASGLHIADVPIEITGTRLTGATRVVLGGPNGQDLPNFQAVDDTRVRAVVPAGLAGGQYPLAVFGNGVFDAAGLTFLVIEGPVADAGPDQTVDPGLVTLDGSRSRDPGGGTLTSYTWVQTGGAAVAVNPTGAQATFAAQAAGGYAFELTVGNGAVTSRPDAVTVTINDVAPSARVSPAQTVLVAGETATLDAGASSDANGDALTFAWTEDPANPAAGVLLGTTATRPTVTPAIGGRYRFAVAVADAANPPATATAELLVYSPQLLPPAADAGPDAAYAFPVGTAPPELTLEGGASMDPDSRGPLAYLWTQVEGPGVVLSNPASARPRFSPAGPGVFVFELVVTDAADDGLASAPDRVTVIVTADNDTCPRAAAAVLVQDADGDGLLEAGEGVVLDASASLDREGAALTYAWTQLEGSALALSSVTAPSPTAQPATAGTYRFAVRASDGVTASPPADLAFHVWPAGTAPGAVAPRAVATSGGDAAPRLALTAGASFTLDGTASLPAPGSGSRRFAWTQRRGPTALIAQATTAQAVVTPLASGRCVFRLEVTDGNGLVDRTDLTVIVDLAGDNAVPEAVITGDAAGTVGAAFLLRADSSTDAPGDADGITGTGDGLRVWWRQTAGAPAPLLDPHAPSLVVSPARAGLYRFELVVGDGASYSRPATHEVQVAADGSGGGGSGGGGGSTAPVSAPGGGSGGACGAAHAAIAWTPGPSEFVVLLLGLATIGLLVWTLRRRGRDRKKNNRR